MNRLVPALVAVLGAAFLLLAALLPEFTAGADRIVPLDPDRLGWVASLVGVLVQAGLFLAPAALLALGQARAAAGGILVGAGALGLTVRLVRIVQLGESPELDPAIGSWIDLLADGSALAAGVLALTSSEDLVEEEAEWEDEMAPEGELAPPPGDPEET